MLGRLISLSSQKGITTLQIAIRRLRTSVIFGSSGHHNESVSTVYIPKPASAEKTWFGTPKASSISSPSPYKPGKDDYMAFLGAGIGVLLTILALTFRTDVFGMNIKKTDLSHKHLHQKIEHEVKALTDEENNKTEVSEEIQSEEKKCSDTDMSEQETLTVNKDDETSISNVIKENDREETSQAVEEDLARNLETGSTPTGKVDY